MELTSSSAIRWRRVLLTLCAIGFILLAFDVLQANTWHGRPGMSYTVTSVPFHDAITAVRPRWPAAKAGIKRGDVVDLRAASAPDRWRFRNGMRADQARTYVILRGATERRVTVRPKHSVFDLSSWSWCVGALGALIFAAIIVWRRPWLLEARLLCLVLVAQVIRVCLAPNNWMTPAVTVDFGAAMVGAVIANLESALLVIYTLLFGRPVSPLRKAIAALAFVIIGLQTLYVLAARAGTWTGAFDLFGGPVGTSSLLTLWEPLAWSMAAPVAIATAVAAARGRERSLLVWTTATLFIMYLTQVAVTVASNLPALASNQSLFSAFRYITNGTQFVTPFAIGYAILNRRILDIGFVLNRAAVFSAVSILILVPFVLVEWALSGWLSTASHATNLMVAGGLALALGVSMRQIHHRVDNVVDRTFFSKRRADQDAIVAFSREASYITDRKVLLERAEETLLKHADASSVEVLLDDRRGHYGGVSENDPAVLALRARHGILDLHDISSDIRGDYVFPMVSRGRVLGVLVLGRKRSGESYAPDELEVVLRLAHGVGSALDVLGHNGVVDASLVKLDAIYETQAAISETLKAVRESLADLTAAIRER